MTPTEELAAADKSPQTLSVSEGSKDVDHDEEENPKPFEGNSDHVSPGETQSRTSTLIAEGPYVSIFDEEKVKIYETLATFEKERVQHYGDLSSLCDPAILCLESQLHKAKALTSQMLKLMKDKAKLILEAAQGHKSLLKHSPSSLTHMFSNEKLNPSAGSPNPAAEDPNPTAPFAHGTQKLSDWLESLHHLIETESQNGSSFAHSVQTGVVEVLNDHLTGDMRKSAVSALTKVTECRARLEKHHKEIAKNWADVAKQFKSQFEKATSRKSDAVSTTPPKMDIWLCERQYLLATQQFKKQLEIYFKCFDEAFDAFKGYLDHKTESSHGAILRFLELAQEFLKLSAGNLGNLHAQIDPQGFEAAKRLHLQQTEETHQRAAALSSSSSSSAELQSKNALPVDTEESAITTFNARFQHLLDAIVTPAPHFEVKKSFVHRQSTTSGGMFYKWSEGYLVLTWDRYLHMFRTYDSPDPVWVAYVPCIEIRTVEEKSKKNIELREKKNLLSMLGRPSYTFQPVSESDLQSWTACLLLASTTSDAKYLQGAELITRSLNAQGMHEYSLHIQRQEHFGDEQSKNEDCD